MGGGKDGRMGCVRQEGAAGRRDVRKVRGGQMVMKNIVSCKVVKK